MTPFGTSPPGGGSRYRWFLVAKYTNKILSTNDRNVGKSAVKIPTENIKKFKDNQIT